MQCLRPGLPFVILFATAACAKARVEPIAPPPGASVTVEQPDESVPTDWKGVALPEHNRWISLVDASFATALAEARGRGFEAAVAAEGPLLDPAAGKERPAPPPGRYRCRVIKLGLSINGRGPGFARFKPFYCFVGIDEALLTLTKVTGTQRFGGRLWDDAPNRLVFLGGIAQGRGDPAPYGGAPAHNLAGTFERIDDFRWRLVTPSMSGDARIDVTELVPDTPPAAEPAQ